MTITVITAVLNRADVLEHALLSVQHQTWPRVEHIVIDGGSTDGTLEILEHHRRRVTRIVSEEDGGIYDALNKGIERSSGEVVGFLHADDFYADDRVLERVAEPFQDPGVDGVYGDLDYVAKHDPARVIRHWRAGRYTPTRLAWGWMPPHPTVYLRRSVFERWGGFDARLRIAADYDAVLRYLGVGRIRLDYLPEVLVKMRMGGASNRSLSSMVRKTREDYAALRRNGVGGLGALAWKNVNKLGQFVVR